MDDARGPQRTPADRRRRLVGFVCAACCSILPLTAPTAAQEGPDSTAAPWIVSVRLTGDPLPTLTETELREQLRTRTNRRFLGLPGVTPGLWLYRVGGEGSVLGRALRRAGEPPVTYDPAVVQADAERLGALFRQEGFLAAHVAVRVDTLAPPEAARPARLHVTFDVEAGPPTYLRRVRYEGLDALTAEERVAWAEATTLDLHPIALDSLRFRAREQRFAERELLEERQALLDFLRARGFARVGRDSVQAVVFGMPGGGIVGAPPDSVDLAFRVRPGPRYRFGDIAFVVTGPEAGATVRTDTFAVGEGQATVRTEGERPLSPRLLRRTLRVVPGALYDVGALLETKQRLERTGVFAFSEIGPLAPDTTGTAAGALPRLPHRIGLRTRRRHSVRLEGFVLQRTGLLGTEAEELALGAGASYRALNLFGGGETLTLRTAGSIAGDLAGGLGGDFSAFSTIQGETGATLTLPTLVAPFGAVERALRPYDARTTFALGLLAARREALGVVVRGRATLGARLEVRHTPAVTSLLDVLDFSLSDPDTLSGFSARFLAFVGDPVARQFVLEDYTRPQVNNAFRYTARVLTADPFRRDRGAAVEASVEAGGNLPALLDRFVFTPGTIEGSLPGLPLFGGDASNRLEYRPYVRGLLDARRYVPRGRAVYAFKVIAGLAHPTGEAPVVPFDRRFFAGGASSVRGWRLRTLGPGGLDAEGAYVQGGDVKLEASAEARVVAIPRLVDAAWQLAAFADAGNVWFGPRTPGDDLGRFRFDRFYRQVGVGAGVGLRVAWEFLILRLDLAWKVHSPVGGTPLFPEGQGRPLLHFGIGQAF